MTDEQIIKAMECCFSSAPEQCEKCPLISQKDELVSCLYQKQRLSLDLIKRQKKEMEELRSDKIIAERHERDARELFVDCTKQLKEVRAEIKRLQKELKTMKTSANIYKHGMLSAESERNRRANEK